MQPLTSVITNIVTALIITIWIHTFRVWWKLPFVRCKLHLKLSIAKCAKRLCCSLVTSVNKTGIHKVSHYSYLKNSVNGNYSIIKFVSHGWHLYRLHFFGWHLYTFFSCKALTLNCEDSPSGFVKVNINHKNTCTT